MYFGGLVTKNSRERVGYNVSYIMYNTLYVKDGYIMLLSTTNFYCDDKGLPVIDYI